MAVASSRNVNDFAVLAMAEFSAGSPFALISDDCTCFGDRDDGSFDSARLVSAFVIVYLVDLYYVHNLACITEISIPIKCM